jgi:hypothetical protein
VARRPFKGMECLPEASGSLLGHESREARVKEEKEEVKNTLLDLQPSWIDEWQGMPEFIQEDQSPFKSITIHFRNQKDFDDFFSLINQTPTKRKSYWFPIAIPRQVANKRYVEES